MSKADVDVRNRDRRFPKAASPTGHMHVTIHYSPFIPLLYIHGLRLSWLSQQGPYTTTAIRPIAVNIRKMDPPRLERRNVELFDSDGGAVIAGTSLSLISLWLC